MEPRVWSFFYGSFMSPEVMAKVGHTLGEWEVGCVTGFELHIDPHATLLRRPGRTAFGILTPMTHATLAAMYSTQSQGETYLPDAVLVLDSQGRHRPATCYIAPSVEPGRVEAAYVRMILEPARRYGFPDWYLNHIESFLPAGAD